MTEIVAVTGAEGFIGSHLVERLVRHGQRVRAMVLYNSFDSRGWLDTLPAEVLAEVEVLPGDVRDAASANDLVRGARVAYHLAALIAIPYSYRAPRSYVDTNVVGTLNVLEAVRAQDTTRLVHTSTSETYGTARTLAAAIARLMDAEVEIVEDVERLRPKDSEVMRLCCDATYLRERTGWAPRHTRDAGLERTIAWFSDPANLARYRPGDYTR